MSEEFQAALGEIRAYDLQGWGEESVKLGVIHPLLRSLGWATYRVVDEVIPEYPIRGSNNPSGEGKVDYALMVDGHNHVFIEAKAGSVDLTPRNLRASVQSPEDQLGAYCCAARVNLGVLTNGRKWRLYLHKKGRRWEQRHFLDIDLMDAPAQEVEHDLTQFLLRDKFTGNPKKSQPVRDAEELLDDEERKKRQTKNIIAAWNTPDNYRDELETFVLDITMNAGHEEPDSDVVQKFLKTYSPLKLIDTTPPPPPPPPPEPKPSAIVLGNKRRPITKWNQVVDTLGELIYEEQPTGFLEILESLSGFSTSPHELKIPRPISNSGVYVTAHVSAGYAESLFNRLRGRFGYAGHDCYIKTSD